MCTDFFFCVDMLRRELDSVSKSSEFPAQRTSNSYIPIKRPRIRRAAMSVCAAPLLFCLLCFEECVTRSAAIGTPYNNGMKLPDIAIAGGGIIGLAIALEMRRQGAAVTLVDDAQPGFASAAAAGMLAASDPENPPALRELAQRSLELYPDFLSRAASLCDEEVPFETSFTLQLTNHAVALGRSLSPSEVAHLLPALEPLAGYHLLTENSLDPRSLHALLRKAAAASGVHIITGRVTGVVESPATVAVALADGQVLNSEKFVDCRGAWMPGARPRKGQMLRVRLRGELANHAMGNIVIRSPDVYIVPRRDGSAVIGATVEDCGFDIATDPASISELVKRASGLLPAVRTAHVVDTWSGLRPCTPDGLPRIGAISDRMLIAGGHFRNGILLAPATAEAVSELLVRNQPLVDISAFQPDTDAYTAAMR